MIPTYVKVEEKDNYIELTSMLDGTKIQIYGTKNTSDFKALQEEKEVNNEELVSNLLANRMLLNKDNYKDVINLIRKSLNQKIQITIIPTQNCNFRCVYCYEDHINNKISEDSLEGMIKYITSEIEKGEINHITLGWFGGEPLLCSDMIIKYNQLVKDICEKNQIIFTSNMTTNGYLLNVELFKKLLDVGLNGYQITLDGFEHDNKRPLVGGKPSLETILNNLKDISKLDKSYNYSILIRYNILANDSNTDWYDYIGKMFGSDKRFSLIIRKVFETQRLDRNSKNFIPRNDNEDFEKHKEYARKYFTLFDDINDNNPYLSEVCYASLPKGFVLLPDSSIQKCTTTDFIQDKWKVGYATKDGFIIDEEKNKQWTFLPAIKDKCYSCKKLFACMNMQCPKRLIAADNQNLLICDFE